MNRKYVVTGVIITAVLAGGIFAVRTLRPVASGRAVSPYDSAHVKAKGPADAPVQMVEYSDFQCPACARVQVILEKFLAEYEGKVRLVFRHFPLKGHTWASPAHQAAECANRQGRFWEYHDRLYAEQQQWSTPDNPLEKFLSYARDLGLNLEAFASCLSDRQVGEIIHVEKARGDYLQVNSTPTVFINDVRVVGPVELEVRGRLVIEEKLGLAPRKVESSSAAS